MAILNFVYDGTENILFSGPKIWDVLLNDVRVKETEEAFKGAEKIKNRKFPRVDL